MSSDHPDPLSSTGSGQPVFGKIKKLGASEEEQAPEENFIPQEEYYDPNDFQPEAPASPYGQEAPASPYEQSPVAPPTSPSPLQLKKPQAPGPGVPAPPQPPGQNMPHQLSGDDAEAARLRNRTAAHLEYNERAQKTQAQFDGYFEQ